MKELFLLYYLGFPFVGEQTIFLVEELYNSQEKCEKAKEDRISYWKKRYITKELKRLSESMSCILYEK